MSRLIFLLLPFFLLGITMPAWAQSEFAVEAPFAPNQQVDPLTKDHPGRMFTMGLLSGIAGFAGGAIIGSQITQDETMFSGLEGAYYVGSITGGLALAMGIHAGNYSQGSPGYVFLTSLGVGGLGWLATSSSGHGSFLIMTPVMQLAACYLVETKTADNNRHLRNLEPTAEPAKTSNLQGHFLPHKSGFTLGLSGRF